MNNLLILGAGGMGHMIQETALQIGYDSVAFLDDAKKGKDIIGKCCDYENFLQSYDTAVAAFGDNNMRLRWTERLMEAGYQVPAIVHPSAVVSPSAVIGRGSFVMHRAVVNTNTVIEHGVLVSSGAVIDHDSYIASGVNIGLGSIVKANCTIASGVRVEAGDVISKITYDGEENIIASFSDIQEILDNSNIKSESEQINLKVEVIRDGKVLTKNVNAKFNADSNSYMIGITAATRQLSFFEAVNYGWDQFVEMSLLIFTTLGKLITDSANTIGQLSGPAGIYSVTSQITETGSISQLLILLALLSTNIGMFNLLPIPGLDGCQTLFAVVEKIIGRDIPIKLKYLLQVAGLVLVFGLMIYVTINDISRMFG